MYDFDRLPVDKIQEKTYPQAAYIKIIIYYNYLPLIRQNYSLNYPAPSYGDKSVHNCGKNAFSGFSRDLLHHQFLYIIYIII